eukprot:4248776-Pyramimonas_sp.AAC.1
MIAEDRWNAQRQSYAIRRYHRMIVHTCCVQNVLQKLTAYSTSARRVERLVRTGTDPDFLLQAFASSYGGAGKMFTRPLRICGGAKRRPHSYSLNLEPEPLVQLVRVDSNPLSPSHPPIGGHLGRFCLDFFLFEVADSVECKFEPVLYRRKYRHRSD